MPAWADLVSLDLAGLLGHRSIQRCRGMGIAYIRIGAGERAPSRGGRQIWDAQRRPLPASDSYPVIWPYYIDTSNGIGENIETIVRHLTGCCRPADWVSCPCSRWAIQMHRRKDQKRYLQWNTLHLGERKREHWRQARTARDRREVRGGAAGSQRDYCVDAHAK